MSNSNSNRDTNPEPEPDHEMTKKIEISPEELAEMINRSVAAALTAERNPKPVEPSQPELSAQEFNAEERARTREALVFEGARWAAIADEAIEAATREITNPNSRIVHGLTIPLPTVGSGRAPNTSPPDLAAVAAGLMELQAQRNPEFAADANSWFGLGLSDLYRRPAIFRSLVEQGIRRREIRAAQAADHATPAEQPENNPETI